MQTMSISLDFQLLFQKGMSPVGPVSNHPVLCEHPRCLTESKATEGTCT